MWNVAYNTIQQSRTNKDTEHLGSCFVGIRLSNSRFLQPIKHKPNSSRIATWKMNEFLNKLFVRKMKR
jgi:hypothetical protein